MRIEPGINDFKTKYPELVEESLEELPDNLSPVSTKKITWLCSEGHKYDLDPRSRTRIRNSQAKPVGCPYCANRKLLQGFNDLETTYPELSRELQGDPKNTLYTSTIDHHWKCAKGHEWDVSPRLRALKGYGCPFCSGQRLLPGFNDIATTHPEFTQRLKNPEDSVKAVAGSVKKFTWVCEVNPDHEWISTPSSVIGKGTGCPICAGKQIQPGENDLETTHPEISAKLLDQSRGTQISLGSYKVEKWVCPEGHEWDTPVYVRVRNADACPTCSAQSRVSKAEKQILDYVKSLVPDAQGSVRNLIKGELDIYIPSKSIAIEYNGMYWHSDKIRSNDYHQQKTQKCAELGIQLIHIWEDDYTRNPELIHRMIAYKLGVSGLPKIPARKTVVREITTKQARTFLDKNHIQGFGAGSIRLGLFVKDQLVAVTTLKQTGNTLTLERYASSATVQGGQSKFLRYIDKNYSFSEMITFADLSISNGNLYESTGWVKDKVLAPDYKYLYKGKREHKFNFRIKRFKSDPQLQYREGYSERQLAKLNNLPRIYDSGKVRYVRGPETEFVL